MTPERIERLRYVLSRRQPDLTVVTDFVHKQRNLSAIVRNCDAVGIMQAHAVLGDDDYRAFRGTTMGSHRWVDVRRHGNLSDAMDGLRACGMQLVAAHLGPEAIDYREVDYTRPTALVLGAERRGVSAEGVALADVCVSIPMVGMVGSLNVSVACGIILAEVQHQRERAGLYSTQRIDATTYQRLLFEWGHPVVRDYCRDRGLAYPPLDDKGEIENPSAWYARVRAGTAAEREYAGNE
tara:strand:- start:179777 stop:180490 length:714 start_codon:yes stop_codon:yes gene_type:complete